MAWVRIDDEMPGHPKFSGLPIEACWLHVCGLTYCSRYETDGVVKESAVGGLLAGKKSPAATRRLVPKLLEAGLWKRHPDGYEIHDYLTYNPSRAYLETKREATRQRVAKSRASRNGGGNSVTNAVTGRDVTPLVTPLPMPHAPSPQVQDLQGVANSVESVTNVPPPDAPPDPEISHLNPRQRQAIDVLMQNGNPLVAALELVTELGADAVLAKFSEAS